jgi:hypothetical protein
VGAADASRCPFDRIYVRGGTSGKCSPRHALCAKVSGSGLGAGTNLEQLFAAGWSACYLSAMKSVAGKTKVTLPADVAIDVEVDLGTTGGDYGLAARLNISLPGSGSMRGWREVRRRRSRKPRTGHRRRDCRRAAVRVRQSGWRRRSGRGCTGRPYWRLNSSSPVGGRRDEGRAEAEGTAIARLLIERFSEPKMPSRRRVTGQP